VGEVREGPDYGQEGGGSTSNKIINLLLRNEEKGKALGKKKKENHWVEYKRRKKKSYNRRSTSPGKTLVLSCDHQIPEDTASRKRTGWVQHQDAPLIRKKEGARMTVVR